MILPPPKESPAPRRLADDLLDPRPLPSSLLPISVCSPNGQEHLPFLQGLSDLIRLERLHYILTETGHQSQRTRRLGAPGCVGLIIGMAWFPKLSIPAVWRRLHPSPDRPEPVDSAFTQARQRLGSAPLRCLFQELAQPMARPQTRGAFYRGLRLMAWDGTVLDLPDTPENARAFGRPKTGHCEGAFPQVRLLALCELGTRGICGLAIKPIHRGEIRMAPALLPLLKPGMLLIWDRAFLSFALIQGVRKQGAHLLARVKSDIVLRLVRRLDDGSYLSKVYPSPQHRTQDRDGIWVRVIEYTHDDPNRPGFGERNRLLTDLLEPEQLPAEDAPLVYHERWEEELGLDEIKTHLNGRAVPLRSKRPAGVVQEIYGLMLAYYVIRRVILDAAEQCELDPDELSFTGARETLENHLAEALDQAPAAWYRKLVREVGWKRLRARRERWYPRVIKRKVSGWPKKQEKHKHPPQPTKAYCAAVLLLI